VAGNEGMPVMHGVMPQKNQLSGSLVYVKIIRHNAPELIVSARSFQISDSKCQPRYMHCKNGLKGFKSYKSYLNHK